MKVIDLIAKTVRVVTVPALTSGCAMTLLWLSDTVIYRSVLDYLMVLLGLTMVPLLSYGFTAAVPKLREQGRETQRKYAMYFSAVGYLAAFGYGLFAHATGPYRVITGTYVISIVLLLVLNKGLRFKASGHACSTAGPLVAMSYFLGGQYQGPSCGPVRPFPAPPPDGEQSPQKGKPQQRHRRADGQNRAAAQPLKRIQIR